MGKTYATVRKTEEVASLEWYHYIYGGEKNVMLYYWDGERAAALEEIRSRGKEVGEETVLWASVDLHNDTTLEWEKSLR